MFLLYRVRRLVCSCHLAVSAPLGAVPAMLPALQNGILKQKIEGANTPALSQYIVQFTPVSADTDDLAVSIEAMHQLSCCTSPVLARRNR